MRDYGKELEKEVGRNKEWVRSGSCKKFSVVMCG